MILNALALKLKRQAHGDFKGHTALDVVRRNPLPVLLIAAGASWLAWRMAQEARRPRARAGILALGRALRIGPPAS